jgi:hypothetical protein
MSERRKLGFVFEPEIQLQMRKTPTEAGVLFSQSQARATGLFRCVV